MPKLMPQRNIPVKHKNSCETIDAKSAVRDFCEMHQLAAERKRLGYSQSELGEAIGCEQGTVSKMETGKIPITLETLQRAADFLKIDVRRLLPASGRSVVEGGFNECAVSEWKPPDRRGGAKTTGGMFDPTRLAPQAKRPASYMIDHSRAVPFGLMKGTVVITDLARLADEGDLGLANLVDPESGVARTILGRVLGQHLVGPNFANDPEDRTAIESDRIGAIHPVVAWFNAPELMTE